MQVEIILSEGLFNFIWTKLENRLGELQYSRMIMTLASMLEGDFFNFYIKSGIFTSSCALLRVPMNPTIHLSNLLLPSIAHREYLDDIGRPARDR